MTSVLALCSVLSLPAQGEDLKVTDLRLSNHTGTACVISWRTNIPTTINQVLYGLNRYALDRVMNDTLPAPSMLHYVQLLYLKIDTTYFYRVRSDGAEFSVSPTGVDSLRTFPQELPQAPFILYGKVTDQTGSPLKNVLVRSYLKWWRGPGTGIDSSMWFAKLTNESGDFSMDISNYRRYGGGLPQYIQNQTMIYLEILGQTQGVVRDSVLLTASSGVRLQELGVWQLVDERKTAVHGIIEAVSPVLANGISASLVRITILDKDDRPIPNVNLKIIASPDRGVTYMQPQALTDAEGKAWGLVLSDVAEDKNIHVFNLTADSMEIDTVAQVRFVVPPGDITQDKSPPFIYFTSDYGDTEDNLGPYRIISRVVDNFTIDVKLAWTLTGNIYNDTVPMNLVPNTRDYIGEIDGQPYNSVISYFVFAEDSAGFKISMPKDIVTNPFISPYRFEVVSPSIGTVPKMGITRTTDALSLFNTDLPMHIDTWITSNVGISSAAIKWRNRSQTLIFSDIPLSHFGAHYWGHIPAQPENSRIEYFIQVTDSLGQVDRDSRRAPFADLFNYEIISLNLLGEVSYVDTTNFLGSGDVRRARYSVLADLNGDRYLDVVSANYGEPNSISFYNSNSGRFEDVTDVTLGTQGPDPTTCVAVADVDGDDDLDLIFTNEGEQNRLYLNNGLGRFEDVTLKIYAPANIPHLPVEKWHSTCVVADDFNGDGWIDLFIANNTFGGEQNKLLFNDSLGVYRDMTELFLGNPAPDQTVWAMSGDLNGDSFTDIVVINRAQNHYWFRNNGRGVFRINQLTNVSAPQAKGGDLGDVDGDGDLDLLVGQNETQQNELFLNNGLGTFSKDKQGRLPPESDNTYGIRFFDANADGYLDILYLNYDQQNRLLLNNKSGFFSYAPAEMMPTKTGVTRSAVVGDINKDNFPDLYLSEEDRKNTVIFSRPFNNGSGNLPSEFDLLLPENGDTVRDSIVTFTWQASTSWNTNDTTSYNFVLSRDSLFTPDSVVVQLEGLRGTSVTLDSLPEYDSRYWWKVSAYNSVSFPIDSRQVNSFWLFEPQPSDNVPPEFYILLNRNPVFVGYLNIYIISSLTLAADPTLTINLASIQLTRIGENEIWRAQYYTHSSFLLSVNGVNTSGVAGEYVETFSSVLLASAPGRSVIAASDGGAWLTVDQGASSGNLLVLVQKHKPVKSEKMKARLSAINLPGTPGAENLGALLEGECYTFSALDGRLEREVGIWIKGRQAEENNPLSVCILQGGIWRPLPSTYDPETGIYNAATSELGTFALRPAGEGAARIPMPKEFVLGQNSPNPFNPSTIINYTVPGPDPVDKINIRVYNLRGSLVRTLVNRPHLPGNYSVAWDGRGDDGRELPSGVYFYRLSSPRANITRKMVLLR
ncbi:MAG TPA: FG-GAP-like repeat-containing protein [archaeon]|nr:FG-GAP-like repeat-containing protein [archaeon]